MTTCSIVILTYKGKHHLERMLPTLDAAIRNYKGEARFDTRIVDNGCDAATREMSLALFPGLQYLFSPVNDYLFSLNEVIRDIPSDYVLLLNDDIRLDKEMFNELLPLMEQADETLFGISCRNLDWEGEHTISGVRTATYRRGWMSNYYLDFGESTTRYTLYPAGGSTIFRTKYFNALNGFDTLYRPAYCEDTDLGIRAWQNGWKTIYHPKAFVYHREGGSTKDYFEQARLEQLIYRNQMLCMLKNTRQPGFFFWFFLMLPYRLFYNFRNNPNHYKALLQALGRMGAALSRRRASKASVKDSDWMKLLNTPYFPDKQSNLNG